MKFRLIESWNKKIMYHCTDSNHDAFKPNEEGMHFSETEEGAKEVAKDKYRGKDIYLYTCEFNGLAKPLQIDVDPYYFGADALAELFIAVIESKDINRVASKNRDEKGEAININVNAKEVIHIDNLTQQDLTELEKYFNYRQENNYSSLSEEEQVNIDVENITQIGKFLENKGYNCIIYPLAESKVADEAIVIIDPKYVKILNKQFLGKLNS